jgi:hypothetical protein
MRFPKPKSSVVTGSPFHFIFCFIIHCLLMFVLFGSYKAVDVAIFASIYLLFYVIATKIYPEDYE